MRHNQPRWIPLAGEILASLGNGTRSSKSDATTHRVTVNIIKTLLRGQSLSDSLATAFVESIRRRTGREGFVWTEKIKLSRDQRIKGCRRYPEYAPLTKADAKATPSLSGMVRREEYDELATRVAFLESLVLREALEKLPIADREATEKLPSGPETARNTAQDCDSGESKSYVTERNETKHHESMISPYGSPPHGNESEAHSSSTSLDHDTHKDHKPALSVFAKSDAKGRPSVSGNLDLDGVKYRVVFKSFDATLQSLEKVASPDATAWRSYFNTTYGEAITRYERSQTGAARLTLGALYDTGDSFGYKAPVAPTAAVALISENGEPAHAIIYSGEEEVSVPLTKFSHSRHPYYKGYIQ